MALLTKQAWRIVQNETSLMHQVYKAKYFPNSNFFDAHLGPNLSYAWRGIWETKEILLRGDRWRIGDGSRVRIWQDNWVSKLFPLPITQNTLSLEPHTATVSMLMDTSSSYWNLEALYSLLDDPKTAAAIQKIPLSSSHYSDKWIWSGEKNGNFSV